MRTIAIVNQKGGCGKTTTAINLAAVLARRGVRTLLVDLDSQSHCAAGLGVPEERIEYTVGDALLADHDRNLDTASLIWEVGRNLHLAPSSMRMAGLEAPGGGLHERQDKDRRLASLLGILSPRYEVCLVDCPPTIGLLTYNALRALREALIPVETGFFALRGAEKQWTTIQRLIAHIGVPIACHMLPVLHNAESGLSEGILATLRRKFAGQILPLVIREHETLREAASFGQPVVEYDAESVARAEFEALADWLDAHEPQRCPQIEIMSPQVTSISATSSSAYEPDAEDKGDGGARSVSAPPPSLTPIGMTARGPAPASRAAELVERVRDLAQRGDRPAAPASAMIEIREMLAPVAAPMPRVASEAEAEATPGTEAEPETTRGPAFGAVSTPRGVRFAQPGEPGIAVAVAGDFNHWLPVPLGYDAAGGVYETTIPVAPGRHQYRIIVDGRWQADPYNEARETNEYGEHNSVVLVGETAGTRDD